MAIEHVRDLILLVGHNAMPNYITACILQPECIHWLYTKETDAERQRLEAALNKKFPTLTFARHFIADATSPIAIRDAMASIPDDAWLNYTGGTKAMTVQAHAYWHKQLGGQESRSSYLDGYGGRLRFDDGRDKEVLLSASLLGVDRILELHGLERDPDVTVSPAANIQSEDKDLLLKAVFQDPDRAAALYRECFPLRHAPNKCKQPLDLGFLPEEARPYFTKSANWPAEASEKVKKAWGDFLTGGWFEEWVEEVINKANALAGLNLQIAGGVRPRKEVGGQTELDSVVLRGHYVYLISCTTEADPKQAHIVAGKCYEARNRVELVGGDLARAAVVCLLPPDAALRVEQKVEVPWQPIHNAVKVFHREHVREWSHASPNYSTLVEWLKS